MIYNKGYDVYIDINIKGGIDIIYRGEILPQYIGSKTKYKHPYPLVFVPGHGEACVHRMVAFSYGILTNPKQKIDHIDNNPYNSQPYNLRVCDAHSNQEYRKDQRPRNKTNMMAWEQYWRNTTKTI